MAGGISENNKAVVENPVSRHYKVAQNIGRAISAEDYKIWEVGQIVSEDEFPANELPRLIQIGALVELGGKEVVIVRA